jgi:hypothetical protein
VRYREPVISGLEILGGRRGKKLDMSECGGGGDFETCQLALLISDHLLLEPRSA